MTKSSYGAASRRPVFSGNRRVPGLFERTLARGATVYEASMRVGGQMRRHRLEAETKTDAIRELREWQVDVDRGDPRALGGLTLSELAADWLAHLTAPSGIAIRGSGEAPARWSYTGSGSNSGSCRRSARALLPT